MLSSDFSGGTHAYYTTRNARACVASCEAVRVAALAKVILKKKRGASGD